MTVPRKPTVMIFADASFCTRTKQAGWGAWIKADGHEAITCGAAMRSAVADNHEAELFALANALCIARLRGLLRRGEAVMIQSDSNVALAIIRGRCGLVEDRPAAGGHVVHPIRKMKLRKAHRDAVAVITEVLVATGISLITRHVKGHQGGSGRQWVNRAVDRLARTSMREARAGVQAKPVEQVTA